MPSSLDGEMIIDSAVISEVFRQVESCLREYQPQLVEAAGNVAIKYKGDNTVVTEFDHGIESRVRTIIASITPEAGILGEEFGQQGSDKTMWTIDPIDGTEHFMRGDPFYTFMLGLVVDNVPTASLMYNYERDMLFKAQDGHATCNGTVISVSDRSLDHAMVEVETNISASNAYELIKSIGVASYCAQKPGACAGFGFTQVARGATEARVQLNGYGKLYDYLPGQILVQMAGGTLQTPGKDQWDWRDLNSIVSNKAVADDLNTIAEGWLAQEGL